MRHIRLALILGAFSAAPALAADPPVFPSYSTGNGSVIGTVGMGLNAANQAVPCGSSTVVAGCGAGQVAPTQAPLTPTAPSGALTLITGGTAQPLALAGSAAHGCLIYNPPTAALQNVSVAENATIDLTGATATLTSGGTSFALLPGASYPCAGGLTTGISWNAATTGHKISAMVY